MDIATIQIYNDDANSIANLHEALVPERLYQLIMEFFTADGKTLDIGCGSGRDSAWLVKNGFDVLGIDASTGMLDEAKKRHSELTFQEIALPELAGIRDDSYANVLCSAVLMHLAHDSLESAAKNIFRILVKGGVLLLSFRGTRESSKRENGKLYEPITKDEAIALFEQQGGELLFYESILESGRNHLWHTFIFRK